MKVRVKMANAPHVCSMLRCRRSVRLHRSEQGMITTGIAIFRLKRAGMETLKALERFGPCLVDIHESSRVETI